MAIPEELKTTGWYQHEFCRCGGIMVYKYRNKNKPGLQVNYRPGYKDFKVFDRNTTIRSWTAVKQLEQTLAEL